MQDNFLVQITSVLIMGKYRYWSAEALPVNVFLRIYAKNQFGPNGIFSICTNIEPTFPAGVAISRFVLICSPISFLLQGQQLLNL